MIPLKIVPRTRKMMNRKSRRQFAVQNHPDRDGENKKAGQDYTRHNAAGKEPCHRYVLPTGIDDQDHAGRYEDTQGTGYGDGAQGKLDIVAGFFHLGKAYLAEGGHRCQA
jgi:hypothetical protein